MYTKKSISRIFSVLFVLTFILELAFSTLFITQAHAAGIRFVTPNGTGNCSSWTNACTLQTALSGATSSDEVWVAAGTHKPTTGADRTATFQLKTGVAIYGGFAGTETARNQRNFTTNVTILSGDIDNDDSQAPIITDLTTVTGNTTNSYHVVSGATGATLDGFTITAGNANGASDPTWYGGGMYNNVDSPTLTNITFSGNTATEYGGGMYNDDSRPQLTNVTFNGNSATDSGGGMYNEYSDPTLINVAFNSNTADTGGGITNSYSDPALSNVIISGNSAGDGGGGMYCRYSAPTLVDVTFSSNTAYNIGGGLYNRYYGNPKLTNVTFDSNSATNTNGKGGGIYSFESNMMLENVTFSGNWALNNGGGIYTVMDGNGSPKLTNVTFSGNTAYNNGGGIYTDYSHLTLTNLTFSNNSAVNGGGMYVRDNSQIRNTIFWGNTATISGTQIYYMSGPLALSDSVVQDGCPAGGTCTNIITADPALGTLGNYGGFPQTVPLQVNSSAINTGNDTICPTTDARGVARPQYAHCDIGAYESDTTAPIVVSITRVNPSPTNLAFVNFTVTFAESVTDVDVTDFNVTTTGVTGAIVYGVSGSGNVYNVAVFTGAGEGTIRLDVVDDDTIMDLALNPLGGVGAGNGNFSGGEVYVMGLSKTYIPLIIKD